MKKTSQKELLKKMTLALFAQEMLSRITRDQALPLPDDPAYTPFIGRWNGYHSPEQRYAEFALERRNLRRWCIAEAKKMGLL